MVRGQWTHLARMQRSHLYCFQKKIRMTTESQDLGLTSHPKDVLVDSIVFLSLYWGVRTHTDHRVSPPCWPQ